MRQVTRRGRWVWVLSGVITAAALVVPGIRLFDSAALGPAQPPPGINVTVQATPTSAP